MDSEQLVCPTCARLHAGSERFCEACGMPLVHPHAGELQASERQQRARKIKPQYTEGELVKVAQASNRPEAEFLANLLLEEGIPCLLRNAIGGYGALIGTREVMVPASAAQAAQEALAYRRP